MLVQLIAGNRVAFVLIALLFQPRLLISSIEYQFAPAKIIIGVEGDKMRFIGEPQCAFAYRQAIVKADRGTVAQRKEAVRAGLVARAEYRAKRPCVGPEILVDKVGAEVGRRLPSE